MYKHYIEEYHRTRDWFEELDSDKEVKWRKIWDENLDRVKGNIPRKLSKESKGKEEERQRRGR